MLGTADAYLLPSQPGLGYLMVDTGVLVELRDALVSSTRRMPSERVS